MCVYIYNAILVVKEYLDYCFVPFFLIYKVYMYKQIHI